jgi:uncharacterized protein YhaN
MSSDGELLSIQAEIARLAKRVEEMQLERLKNNETVEWFDLLSSVAAKTLTSRINSLEARIEDMHCLLRECSFGYKMNYTARKEKEERDAEIQAKIDKMDEERIAASQPFHERNARCQKFFDDLNQEESP